MAMSSIRGWIFDKEATPQGFPLRRLLERAIEVLKPSGDSWRVIKMRGYGLKINELEEALGNDETMPVDVELLLSLSIGKDEWFYDFETHIGETGVRVGLHDSWAIFALGPSQDVMSIISTFNDYRVEDATRE
jgi:hypothetical protein